MGCRKKFVGDLARKVPRKVQKSGIMQRPDLVFAQIFTENTSINLGWVAENFRERRKNRKKGLTSSGSLAKTRRPILLKPTTHIVTSIYYLMR